MPSPIPATLAENGRAIGLLTVSMGMFTVEDMLIKKASAFVSVGQILIVLGLVGAGFYFTLARIKQQKIFSKDLMERPMIIRTTGEIIGSIGFTTALALIPLSNASAILQATPLVVTMAAALFLGEEVGWRRWSAVLVGFIGVLLIIQPGTDGFTAYSFFAVMGVIGLSMRDVATRRLSPNIPTIVIAAWAFVAIMPGGILLVIWSDGWKPFSAHSTMLVGGAACIGIVAYYAITTALRMGDIAVIAPFRYVRLLFAIALGYVFFDEVPDALMILGCLLIVGTGLYALYRERLRKYEGEASTG